MSVYNEFRVTARRQSIESVHDRGCVISAKLERRRGYTVLVMDAIERYSMLCNEMHQHANPIIAKSLFIP